MRRSCDFDWLGGRKSASAWNVFIEGAPCPDWRGVFCCLTSDEDVEPGVVCHDSRWFEYKAEIEMSDVEDNECAPGGSRRRRIVSALVFQH